MLRTITEHMDVVRGMNHDDFERWQDDVARLSINTNAASRDRYNQTRQRAKRSGTGSR